MICPKCKKSDPQNREMCPDCGAPVKPIPEPPGGKIRFGGYDWYVLEKQDGKTLIITEKVIAKRSYHDRECGITWETCGLRDYLYGGENDEKTVGRTISESGSLFENTGAGY